MTQEYKNQSINSAAINIVENTFREVIKTFNPHW